MHDQHDDGDDVVEDEKHFLFSVGGSDPGQAQADAGRPNSL
jgi:hypothetical protein